MREILFRGKTGGGDWVYGYYVLVNDISKIFVPFSQEDKEFFKNSEYEKIGGRYKDVIPETIGQYTGLTDKNGTKIFEGDIVKREFTLHHGETKKTRETQIGVVGFKRGEFMANVIKGRGTWFGIGIVWKGDYLEIIGNIHDNPKLLNESEGGEG